MPSKKNIRNSKEESKENNDEDEDDEDRSTDDEDYKITRQSRTHNLLLRDCKNHKILKTNKIGKLSRSRGSQSSQTNMYTK